MALTFQPIHLDDQQRWIEDGPAELAEGHIEEAVIEALAEPPAERVELAQQRAGIAQALIMPPQALRQPQEVSPLMAVADPQARQPGKLDARVVLLPVQHRIGRGDLVG